MAIVSHDPGSTRHAPIKEHTGAVGGMDMTFIDARGLSNASIANEKICEGFQRSHTKEGRRSVYMSTTF